MCWVFPNLFDVVLHLSSSTLYPLVWLGAIIGLLIDYCSTFTVILPWRKRLAFNGESARKHMLLCDFVTRKYKIHRFLGFTH